jgi:S1-C subfamily serine protease
VVLPSGPADRAGLRVGDQVRSIGTENVGSVQDCTNLLAKHAEGAKLTFAIIRDGRSQEIIVELGKGL